MLFDAFRNFRRLGRDEKELFVLALALMAGTRVALLGIPFQRIARFLDGMNRRFRRPESARSVDLAIASKRLIQAQRYCPLPITCLAAALAGKAILARYGHPSELKIGVKTGSRGFEAHAWLECPGNILIGSSAPAGEAFVPFPTIERFLR